MIALVTYAVTSGKLPTTNKAYADELKVVSLYADDQKRVFTTDAETVGDLLERTKIQLAADDLVEPSMDTPIPAGAFNVNIYRARPVLIEDGRNQQVVNTPYSSPKLIAKDADIKTYPEDDFNNQFVTNFVGDAMVGEKVIIKRAKPVTLVADGVTKQIRTQAETVGEMLTEKKIPMGERDTTSMALEAPIVAGDSITITRVAEVVVTKHEQLANKTRTVRDGSMYQGESKVVEAGKAGGRDVTYKINYHDGVEVARQTLKIDNLVEPVTRVVHVGTKIRDDVWYRLRMCESTNTYTRNSGNGYYGAYQFLPSTWRSLGYSGMPHQASPATQDEAAKRLQARDGWGPWPTCARRLGLL